MNTTKKPLRGSLHVHVYTPFPSDARFEHCVCGQARRADRVSENPCVQWWGRGPAGEVCRDCVHLLTEHYAHSCLLRQAVRSHHGHLDHRTQWEACANWVQRESHMEVKP